MLTRLAWVLGLGTVGLFLFGPFMGSVLGAIGFAIGSQKALPPKSREPDALGPSADEHREQSDVTSTDAATAPRERSHVRLWIAGGAIAAVVLWLLMGTDSPVDNSDRAWEVLVKAPSDRTPVVPDSKLWSPDDCLHQHFGVALARGLAVPPEVRVFCAYPWDVTALQKLTQELALLGVEPERLLNELKPAPPQIELLRRLMAANLKMPMPDGVREIFILMKVLPYVWAARPDKSAWKPLLRKNVGQGFVGTLTQASVKVDWKQKLTNDSFVRVHNLQKDVVFFDERGTSLTVEELVPLVIAMYDKRLDKLEENPLTETMRSIQSSGLHLKHGQAILMLTIESGLLEALSDHLRGEPTLQAAWRPAKVESRSAARPLEIYVMRAPIDGWCKDGRANAHGQYCQDEDRILILEKTEPSLNLSGKDSALGMNAAISHELAHAYLNPKDANEYPFVTEGLATAFGERMLRATFAAIPAASSLSLEQSAAFGRIFQAPTTDVTAPSGSVHSNSERLEYARKHIEQSRPTPYVQSALCRVNARPLASGPVITYLSQSKTTFASNADEEIRLAYAYAWAIFHYGIDAAGIGLGLEGNQVDATTVQEVATMLASNRAPDSALVERLDKLLAQVNARARADIKKWRIACQK